MGPERLNQSACVVTVLSSWDRAMRMKLVPMAMIVLAVLGVGYGLWRREKDPPKVISTGIFQFKDKAGTELVFPKRLVSVAGFEKTEVQLPGGTWIDCRGDCGHAIRSEHTEFWDHQNLKTR
jgi:hypothetical protein